VTTSPKKRFRFGFVCDRVDDLRSWRKLAREVESTGFSTLLISDHFFNGVAPLTALAVAADATSTLRVGTLVLANDFRHPAVLAKELATLDLLSEGRLEIGIGAGWLRGEYEQAGLVYEPASKRIERLRESIEIMRGLFGPEPLSYAGSHYTIANLDGLPKPAQAPAPPILVGGAGRRLLEIAGRLADIVGIAPNVTRDGAVDTSSFRAEAIANKVRLIHAAAGDRTVPLELNIQLAGPVMVQPNSRDGARAILDWRRRVRGTIGPSEDDVLESPSFAVGRYDDIVDRLKRQRDELGISYFVTGVAGDADLHAFAPIVERLAGT